MKYRECHDNDGVFKPGFTKCEYKSLAQLENGDTYTPFVPDKEKGQKFPAWLNDPKYYHNQGDTTFQGENSLYGDFNGLDDLNTEHPDVLTGMIEIYKNIIKEFKPDGFRVDTVRHVKLPFWQEFGPAIMDYAKEQGIPNFHIFGEVYDANPYSLSSFTTTGKLPAVLDFGFQDAAAKVFYKDEGTQSVSTLFDLDDVYNDHDSQADLLLTFLGNHDMGRTGYFINEGLPDASDADKLQRSILSHAFMYMSRGIPVVYYGDEQGFTGDGNDVDAREDMFASEVDSYNDNKLLGSTQTTAENNFNKQHPIYQAIASFAKLRLSHKALRRGVNVNRFFDESSKVFAFSRVDLDEKKEYLIAFNAGTTAASFSVDASAASYSAVTTGANPVVAGGKVKLSLAPLSFAVIKADERYAENSDLNIELAESCVKGQDDERVQFNYTLAGESGSVLPIYKVTTEYKNSKGDYVLAAHDYTAPYSSFITKADMEKGCAGELRVTVDNLDGSSKVHMLSIK